VTGGADRRPLARWKPESYLLAVALAVGVTASGLWFAAEPDAARTLLGAFGLLSAALLAIRMVRQMVRGTFGVDVLAVVAILATVLTGEVVATLIIVIMVAGGSALEDFAQRRAERDLDALLDREPVSAHLVVEGGIQDVPVGEVRIGHDLLVRSGEVVPVDGTLVTGHAAFDDSPLTGESLPVVRSTGDHVPSGSVNGALPVTIRAERLARDSQYQAIVALVAGASENRAPVVRLADRFAVPFTVVSLAIAGLAWWLSGDPVRFAEVVVLATPCPLLLAAPVGFIGGMSRAARNGVVVKGGAVLETLSRARSVVVDKTGTVTLGTPTVVRVDPVAPLTADRLLALVASAETLSSHVLAASIVDSAERRGLETFEATDAREEEARGIDATVEGVRVSVGTAAFVGREGTAVAPAELVGGELAVYVAIDGRFAGTIVATDPVRPETRDTLAALRRIGIERIVMLTGDAASTARHIAEVTGIDEFQADCLPRDKVDRVASMIARPVVMVGDGINDAPVLAAADVGMAMGARGATAASEAADAVILVDDFSRVERVVRISHDTVRIVYQSIWIGILISIALMVVASFGVIPATVGAALQEAVDLATVLNALRVLRDPSRPREPGGRREPARGAALEQAAGARESTTRAAAGRRPAR